MKFFTQLALNLISRKKLWSLHSYGSFFKVDFMENSRNWVIQYATLMEELVKSHLSLLQIKGRKGKFKVLAWGLIHGKICEIVQLALISISRKNREIILCSLIWMLYVASSLYAASMLYVNFNYIQRLYALCFTFSIATMLYAQCSMPYALCIEVKLPNGFKPYKYLAHHFNQVHKKSFTCDTCSKQFGSKYLLSIGGVWFDLHRWFDLHIFQHTRIQHANNSTYHNSTYK